MSCKPLVRLAISAAVLLTGVCAPAAFADTQTLSTRVVYGDLDLTQKAGVDVLAIRLNRAAERVCPSSPQGAFRISEKARVCRQEAVQKAVADIGSQELTARLNPTRAYPLASR